MTGASGDAAVRETPDSVAATVGVVGVGSLGLAIAGALLKSGFRVLGYRRSALPAAFVDLGGEPVRSSVELAARCDVVLTILPSDGALDDVVAGSDGLLAGAHDGLVVAELSTLSLEAKHLCRDRFAQRDIPVLDCPISGMPAMVATRDAAVLGSGDPFAFERARPVFDGFSDAVHYLGDFGTGTTMKYVSYTLLANHTMAAAEALALARRGGLDLDVVRQVVRGSVGDSVAFERRAPKMIDGAYLPASGSIDTLRQGLAEVREFAAALGCVLPLSDTTYRYLLAAQEAGRGDQDTAALFAVVSETTPTPTGGTP